MQRYILHTRTKGINMRRFQDILCSLRRFSQSEVAEERMKIIHLFNETS